MYGAAGFGVRASLLPSSWPATRRIGTAAARYCKSQLLVFVINCVLLRTLIAAKCVQSAAPIILLVIVSTSELAGRTVTSCSHRIVCSCEHGRASWENVPQLATTFTDLLLCVHLSYPIFGCHEHVTASCATSLSCRRAHAIHSSAAESCITASPIHPFSYVAQQEQFPANSHCNIQLPD
jgi:hypothetical protein